VTDPALLVGLAPFDDAAVYRVADDLALVSTTDFFPPLVDDPGDFGAIAAANACSDVFAMGGRVVTALNLSAFPSASRCRPIAAILQAAAAVVAEAAGAWPAGTRSARTSRSSGWRSRGSSTPTGSSPRAAPASGDALVLSKPLGTGIVLAAGSAETRRLARSGCAA
jgi:selenide,water dikinase